MLWILLLIYYSRPIWGLDQVKWFWLKTHFFTYVFAPWIDSIWVLPSIEKGASIPSSGEPGTPALATRPNYTRLNITLHRYHALHCIRTRNSRATLLHLHRETPQYNYWCHDHDAIVVIHISCLIEIYIRKIIR